MISAAARVLARTAAVCALSALLCVSGGSPARAEEQRIGLVLAGGGALGFAHVGVLKVLEENRIPVHVVTGASMGAIVGAAYASGNSVAQLEKVLSETDWDSLFSESSARRSVAYRDKPGRNRELFGDTKIAFDANGIVLPAGLIQGQYIVPVLRKLYADVPVPMSFDELPLPFRAVTADIENGTAYVPSRGDLTAVVRASMSVPAVFAPVEIDGRLLVDGGIANNLPVDVALSLGAEQLIVVELFADLQKREKLRNSPLAITSQMVSLLLAQNSTLQRQLMRRRDILIAPDLAGYAATDFGKSKALMDLGEAAARRMLPRLKKLAVSPAEYARYQRTRRLGHSPVPTLDFIRIESDSPLTEAKLRRLLPFRTGEEFDREKIEESVRAAYQAGEFREIHYNVVEEDGRKGLVVTAQRKEWLDNFVRIGVAIEDDFEGEHRYRVAGSYRTRRVTNPASYLESNLEIGISPNFSAELYNPLATGSPFFFAPSVFVGRNPVNLRVGSDIVAEYLRTAGGATIRAGRELGTSGELHVGFTRGTGKLEREIGSSSLPEGSYDVGDLFASLVIDDLDGPDFPTEGTLVRLIPRTALDELGATSAFSDVSGGVSLPFTVGRDTLTVKTTFSHAFDSRPVERANPIGGFLELSGYEQGSVLASDYWIRQLVYYHRFSELKLPIFGLDFFAGGTIESAEVRSDVEQLADLGTITAGSVFIGADTPLLPAYFSMGLNDNDDFAIYFVLGRISNEAARR